jgi:hypothetical protein
MTTAILDNIHRPAFYLKHGVSEIGLPHFSRGDYSAAAH